MAYMLETQDSDEIQEMYCEPCERHESKYKPAAGFCTDCVEYMCDTCLKYHKRYVTSHILKDKDGMPQEFCFDKCSSHSSQLVKFFCNTCQKIACSECKAKDHKNCANVSHLPAAADGIEQSVELKDLFEEIDTLTKEIEKIDKQTDLNIQRVLTQENKTLAKTKQCREVLLTTYKHQQQVTIDKFDKKMEETISKLRKERQLIVDQEAEKLSEFEKMLNADEKNVTEKVENTTNIDQKELQAIKDKDLTMKNELKMLASDLAKQKNVGQRCKLYITMKLAQDNVEHLKQEVSIVKQKNEIHYYDVISEEKKLDDKSLATSKTYLSYKELQPSERDSIDHYQSDISIKRVLSSSLCLLNEHTLLLTDFNAKVLTILRETDRKTRSCNMMAMLSGPWAITKVKNNNVAVTFPDEGIVKLLTFSATMEAISAHDIKAGAQCRGIAHGNNTFVVSYNSKPGKVQILDSAGHVLTSFHEDLHGRFEEPLFLTLSPDNTIIYVSDCHRNTVTSMTFEGQAKAIYKNDQLKGPCQLTADELGTVYVCGMRSNNVHQLSLDLTQATVLLDESQEIYRPMSITYCEKSKKLYVGMNNSKRIKVFYL